MLRVRQARLEPFRDDHPCQKRRYGQKIIKGPPVPPGGVQGHQHHIACLRVGEHSSPQKIGICVQKAAGKSQAQPHTQHLVRRGALQCFAFTPQKCGNGMQHTVLPSLAGRARRLQTSL